MTPRNRRVSSLVMDRPIRLQEPALGPIARDFAEGERLREFLDDPAEARVSEALLPLFLAGLHRARRARWSSSCRTMPRPGTRPKAPAGSSARTTSGFSRRAAFAGAAVSSRRRTSSVSAPARSRSWRRAGSSARLRSASRRAPPAGARPEPIVLRVGDEPGAEALSERLALAGYERVPQAEGRGQFAVRGGILDVFPSTGREPVRLELFGDEIESLRAFSPFTQRTLHALESATVYPAVERRLDLVEPMLAEEGEPAPLPDDLVAPLPKPDLVWQADEVEEVVREELGTTVDLRGALRLTQLPAGQRHSFEAQRPAVAARGLAEAERDLLAYVKSGSRVVVTFAHRGEAQRTKAMLRRLDAVVLDPGDDLPDEPGLFFAVSPARRGFVLRDLDLILLPDTQVFRKRPPRADARIGRALQSFADLRTGDHVVHEDHGVGMLLGFETKTVAGVTRDYLFLAFRGDDRLYVPHEQIGKVSRYVGADGHTPALSKLGGKAWQTIKNRARAGAHELAGELLALYARRQQAEGVAFEAESELVERLETTFAYEETPDQRQAIEVVKEDLETPRPMDRLVCGDVGFGKTEVAVRAAFIAVANGAQALLLAPTTILAQQHWNTFRERYRDLPVTVEMISRFRKAADVKQVLADFAAGKVDVLIGTHRVLSRDVASKNLGLVIVDEEQRFGVAQKELLRQLRLEVDVLALSATPIPRTLHMSLAGLRDISVIETPPQGRRPIRTHVGEYDEELVREALVREHAREGQSFFLHNRVESIEEAAEHLRQLVPELRIIVAHGQMPERELEGHMLSFLAGDADVLVSTTIIESGLDIPQANTLIVERADALGLAQLYQIRGRVGRSDVVAHAYLFYPDGQELTAEARARLATLADHTELGSGFAIAMRDLEIRGAGDLLGAEQSGHVAAIGFELYVELLGEAVAELTGTRRAAARPVRVDAQVDAYVPADYMPAEAQKIDLHRRLALAETEDELRELRAATEDRFGPVPEPVESLFAIQEVKLKLARIGADYLVFRGGRAVVGPLVLGSAELRELRTTAATAVYSSAKRELTQRGERFPQALAFVDAILDLRLSA